MRKSRYQRALEGFELDEISFTDDLEDFLIELTKMYTARLEGADGTFTDSNPRAVSAWFRRIAYRLIRRSIEGQRPFAQLYDRIEAFGRSARGIKGREGPFQRGLLAMMAHAPSLMSADQRYQNGRQLEYAHHHRIPPEFLEAFLRDVGARRAIDNASLLDVEPDYREWVVGRLIKERTPKVELRAYPLGVRRLVVRGLREREKHLKEQAAYYYRLANGYPEPQRDWDAPVLAVRDDIADLIARLCKANRQLEPSQLSVSRFESEIEVLAAQARDGMDLKSVQEVCRTMEDEQIDGAFAMLNNLRLQPKREPNFRW